MPDRVIDEGTKVQAVTLLSVGVSSKEVSAVTGISTSQINRLRAKAVSRGWNPGSALRLEHVVDASRSGRPPKVTAETDAQLAGIIRKDKLGRAKTLDELAAILDLGASTVRRRLKIMGFNCVKPSVKPGLTQKMQTDRLKWC